MGSGRRCVRRRGNGVAGIEVLEVLWEDEHVEDRDVVVERGDHEYLATVSSVLDARQGEI